MAYTFDGTTLPNVGLINPAMTGAEVWEVTITGMATTTTAVIAIADKAGQVSKWTLLSGKTKISTTGTRGTLVLGGETYANCAIDGGVQMDEVGGNPPGGFGYTVKFVQMTAPTS